MFSTKNFPDRIKIGKFFIYTTKYSQNDTEPILTKFMIPW